MAERRMFAKTIIDSDAFLDMPMSAQALYFHMAMRADDDGFLNNPKKVQRIVGASDDDCRILLAKRFLIAFESGVVVIKHWRIHNYIAKDRYKPTAYQEELSMLETKDNGAYTTCQHPVYELDTQDRLDKDRLVEDRLVESGASKPRKNKFVPPTLEEVNAYVTEMGLNVDAKKFLDYYEAGEWVDGKGNPVKNWKQKLLTWDRKGSKTAAAEAMTSVHGAIKEKVDTDRLRKVLEDMGGFYD